MISGLIGFVMVALYITVIIAQGSVSIFYVLPWVVVMALASIAAIGPALTHEPRLAKGLMIASASVFTLLGLVSILTIGLGFLVAAAVGWIGVTQLSRLDRA